MRFSSFPVPEFTLRIIEVFLQYICSGNLLIENISIQIPQGKI